MTEHLELAGPTGTQLHALVGSRVTLGRQDGNDLVLSADENVSRVHAILERLGPGWCIRDVGSRNGTYVNGARISAERMIHPGDEIRVGATRLVYRSGAQDGDAPMITAAQAPAPTLTPREHEVLVALCRPLFANALVGVPASARRIAIELVVTEDAIKQHLLRLYAKFGIEPEEGSARRVLLAKEAVLRNAVGRADYEAAQR